MVPKGRAGATIVRVGLAALDVGKTELPEM